MAHLWIAIPLIVALLSLEANDALKVLVMFIVIGAGVYAFLYARVDLGMSQEAVNAKSDDWLGTSLVLLGVMVAVLVPPVALAIVRGRRERTE